MQSDQIGEGLVSVYSLQGKLIRKQAIELIPGVQENSLRLPENTRAGIYLVRVVTPQWTEVHKVFIKK